MQIIQNGLNCQQFFKNAINLIQKTLLQEIFFDNFNDKGDMDRGTPLREVSDYKY